MNSFKEVAYQILKEAGKPLHSKEITRIALERGWLKTVGKTPEATMNAQIVVDINTKKGASRFIKTAPSIFGLNPSPTLEVRAQDKVKVVDEAPKLEKKWKISNNISTKQKGDIAEARIAELITLYGDTTLSCYKPISDDEGIDLIVKEKGSLKTMYIQVKSRFGDSIEEPFVVRVKEKALTENYSMAIVFCFFDTEEGDVWDYVWFVPAPDFMKKSRAVQYQDGRAYSFVAGKKHRESNKWDQYLIDKRDLANAILAQMRRI